MLQRALLCPHCGFQSPTAEHAAHHLIVTCPRRLVHCPSSHQNCKYSSSSSSSRAILCKIDLQHHMDLECEGKDFACQECGKNNFENFSTWNAHVHPFCASSIPPPCPLCNELLVINVEVGADGDDDEINKIDSRALFANHLISCAGNYLITKRRKTNSSSANSMSSPQQQFVPAALRSSVETVAGGSAAGEVGSKKNQPVFKDPRSLFFFDDDDYGHSLAPSTRHNSPVNQQQQQQNQFDRKSTSPRTGMLNQAMINGGISFFAGGNSHNNNNNSSPTISKKSPRTHAPSPAGVPSSLAELIKVNSVSKEENDNVGVADDKNVDDLPPNQNEKESSPIIFGSWVTEDQKRNKLSDHNNNNGKDATKNNNNMIDTTCVSQIRKNENRLMQDHYVSPPQHIFVKQQQLQDGTDFERETIYQKQQESEVVSSVSRKRFLKPNDKVGNFETNNLVSSSSRENPQDGFGGSGGRTEEQLNNGDDFEDAFSPSPRISDAVIVSKILFGTNSSTSMPSQNYFANVSKTPTFSSRKHNGNHKQLQETKTYSSLYTKKQQPQQFDGGEAPHSFTVETTQNETKSLLPSAIVPVFFSSNATNKFVRTTTTITCGAVTPSSSAKTTMGFSSRRPPQTKFTPPPSSKSTIIATAASRTPRVSSSAVVAATAANKNGNSISARNNNNNNSNPAGMSRTASNSSAFSTSIRRTSSVISNTSASSNTNQNGATKRQPFSALLNMSLVSAVNNNNNVSHQSRTGRNY